MEWVLVFYLYLFIFIAMVIREENKRTKRINKRKEYQREYNKRKKLNKDI